MSEILNSKLEDLNSEKVIHEYYIQLNNHVYNGGQDREIVKGVSELDFLNKLDNNQGTKKVISGFKELAEKHSKAVLEDYIKTHSAKSDTVSTTYPLETKFKVGISAGHSDGYGRVYSDLEGEGDVEKRSSAKTIAEHLLFTKSNMDKPDPRPANLDEHGCNSEGCYAWGEFLKGVEFHNGAYRWKTKFKVEEDVPRGTHKNKYGIGQKAFVINQNDISKCVIQEISEEEDGLIMYTAWDDFGCDFKLTEEEVFTTVDELLYYLHELAKSL